MAAHLNELAPADGTREPAARLGFWVAVLTAFVTAVSFGIGIMTPPHSGPFCTDSCIAYPYADAAKFFPRDYLFLFPGILLPPLFLVLCACVHSFVDVQRRIFSRIAVAMSTVAAAVVTLDYFVQLEVIQPSLLAEEKDGMAIFSQYNPHGLFIAMEDLGYLWMSAAFFFLGLSLARSSGLEVAARRLLTISSVLGLVTFIGMSVYFGNDLQTRFELAVIAINWIALAPAAVMLAMLFRRTLKPAAN